MYKNSIYLCVIANPWIEVAQKLLSEFGIFPSYIVHWQADKAEFSKAYFKDCYFHSIEDAWKGLGFPKNTSRRIFDEEELKLISYYELIALKMMDRLDPDGESFSFNSRSYFFRDLLGYWFTLIEEKEIDLVVSPSIPHRVFDYALYVACKIKKIKFIMCQLTPFGSNSIFIDDINRMPSLDIKKPKGAIPSKFIQRKIFSVLQNYIDAKPNYMVEQEKKSKKGYLNLLLKLLAKAPKLHHFFTTKPNTYWVKKGMSPAQTEYSWLDFVFKIYIRRKKVKSFVTKYNNLVTNQLPTRYILVALHYQPEETSCPTGAFYADQALIIQLLWQSLPKGLDIVVKEHKTQLYTQYESASGRDLAFYRRISEIDKNIKFVSEDFDPFNLIDKAQAIVTISGTIGWESAIRGTPAIVFGRAWYESMPRVLKVKTKDDLVKALSQIEELKGKDLHDDILAYHAALEDNFVKALHYKATLNNKDVTMEESIENLVYGISRMLSLKYNRS